MNRELARAALRAPLFTMAVATTGVISLSANATGYMGAAATFDKSVFAIGMEVLPTGFPQTTPGVITSFTDTQLNIKNGRTVAAAAGSRSLVVGLPSQRAWTPGFQETVGIPFVEDEFTVTTRSRDAIGDSEEDLTGYYYIRPYCVAGVGDEAIDRYTKSMLALYPIGHVFVLADGSVLRIRGYAGPGDVAPVASGSPLPYNTSWRVLPVAIPWRLTTPSA